MSDDVDCFRVTISRGPDKATVLVAVPGSSESHADAEQLVRNQLLKEHGERVIELICRANPSECLMLQTFLGRTGRHLGLVTRRQAFQPLPPRSIGYRRRPSVALRHAA